MEFVTHLFAGLMGAGIVILLNWLRRRREHSANPASSGATGDGGGKARGKNIKTLEHRMTQLERDLQSKVPLSQFQNESAILHVELAALSKKIADRPAEAPTRPSEQEPKSRSFGMDTKRELLPPQEPLTVENSNTKAGQQLEETPDLVQRAPEPDAVGLQKAPSVSDRFEKAAPAASSDLRLEPSELIARNFDNIDALALRRIDRMQEEYWKLLGSALRSISDKYGAYLFLMEDSTILVHPKPNSPLPRFWEKAFPGADSYSRPIKRVSNVARVRFTTDEEYGVLDKGAFEVI